MLGILAMNNSEGILDLDILFHLKNFKLLRKPPYSHFTMKHVSHLKVLKSTFNFQLMLLWFLAAYQEHATQNNTRRFLSRLLYNIFVFLNIDILGIYFFLFFSS